MVHGIVFTKNIAHKKMASQIVNPQILLMRGSIEYQRRVNKFSSLEPQILQVNFKLLSYQGYLQKIHNLIYIHCMRFI